MFLHLLDSFEEKEYFYKVSKILCMSDTLDEEKKEEIRHASVRRMVLEGKDSVSDLFDIFVEMNLNEYERRVFNGFLFELSLSDYDIDRIDSGLRRRLGQILYDVLEEIDDKGFFSEDVGGSYSKALNSWYDIFIDNEMKEIDDDPSYDPYLDEENYDVDSLNRLVFTAPFMIDSPGVRAMLVSRFKDYLLEEISEVDFDFNQKKAILFELLALAFSDGNVSDEEFDFIEAVRVKVDLPKSFLQELSDCVASIIRESAKAEFLVNE
ncbi:hypothetical protein [Oceanospirillum sanctuarii]|uniref:hypothetical protein n=1 Tax=Oceanospirillum sanctuarii TaxID=1434821 RepID=UPI000A3857C4|nr:hypothetical protein [Oceanospirillum sanctuarii]